MIYSMAFLIEMMPVAQGSFAQASNKNERRLHINKSGEVIDNSDIRLDDISKEDIVYNNAVQKLGFIKRVLFMMRMEINWVKLIKAYGIITMRACWS